MSTTRSSSSACSWRPSRSWLASARSSPTRAMTPSTTAASAASSAPSRTFTSVVGRADPDWASAAGRSSAAMPGFWRTSASPCATTGLASSCSRCSRPLVYSWLQGGLLGNSENRLLVVHPLNECDIWRGSDAETAWRAMAPAAAPDERVLVLVPVFGGALDGLLDLGPGVEPSALEGQRAQHLPPRLDEVQVGRVLRLEHHLPAWVGQGEQQHVHAGVDVEVVDHGVDPLGIGHDPALDLPEEVDPNRVYLEKRSFSSSGSSRSLTQRRSATVQGC